jgi:hypothetical protein
MGTVLVTTLGTAFASLELPVAVAAEPAASPERLASTGAAALPGRIRSAYDAMAGDVEAALAARDLRTLGAFARSPDVPEGAQRVLGEAVASGLVGLDEEQLLVAGKGIRAALEVHAAAVGERVERDVREAFTRATNRVYTFGVWIAVVAWLLTWRMPELPLRRTHDRAEPAA